MASLQYYNVGVQYDSTQPRPSINGSNPNYGSAYVRYNGTNYGAGTSVTVLDGSTVEFYAVPATGFKLDFWYDYNTHAQIQDPDNHMAMTVNGSDICMEPSFIPNNPTYNRRVNVTTSGAAGTNNVNISSMNGYYSYDISTTVASKLDEFNGTNALGSRKLPDGKTIRVSAQEITGYDIVFRSGGQVLQSQQYIPVVSGGVSQGTQQGDRGGSVGEESNSGFETSSNDSGWRYVDVTNNISSSTLAIEVEYVAQTNNYTVNTHSNPRTGGTATVTVNGVESTSATVEEGTQVKLMAVPAAGYSFNSWSNGSSERPVYTNPYTYNVTSDDTWTATFTSTVTCITATVDPLNGGQVNITDGVIGGFDQTGQSVTVRSTDTTMPKVTLTAIAATDYTFQYWYNSNDTEVIQYGDRLELEFGEVDEEWIAKFLYTPNDTVSFKAATSMTDGSTLEFGTGHQDVTFTMTYKDMNGVRDELQVGPQAGYADVLIENDGSDHFVDVYFDYSDRIRTVENGRLYRYDLSGFKYAEGHVNQTSSSHISWNNITLTDNRWRLFVNVTGSEREQLFTVTGAYTKTEVFKVETSIVTPSGMHSGITVTGAGEYANGETVTVTTSAQNTDRYRFECWYDTINDEVVSNEPTYSFVVDGNEKLEARYAEYLYVQYSANPTNLGSVSCTDLDTHQSVTSGTYVGYGTELRFTCTPNSGVSILNWTNGNTTIPGSANQEQIDISLSGNINIRARLMETSKKIVVISTGGGNIGMYLKDSGGNYSLMTPDTGTDSTYTVPNNSAVRAVATPAPRYNFESFTLYDSHDAVIGTSTSTQYDIPGVSEDMSLSAVFSFVPWISTLGNIIKVY